MANRYWVGGTATWDATAGTKWALTSGGPGGEAVPTSADDVFFSSASTGTCTVNATVSCKSINCTGFTGTLSIGSTFTLLVYGNATFVTGMTFNSASGNLEFRGTGTLISAGKNLGTMSVNGAGITLTLGDALTTTNIFYLTQGSFDTANFAVSFLSISGNFANTRSLILGSSTLTLSGSAGINLIDSGTLTFSAGTSQINLSNSNPAITTSGGLTFYNVSFTSTTASSISMTGSNTYNNLIFTTPTTLITSITLTANQTINGTLTFGAANTAVRRIFVRSNASGTVVTITANGTLSALSDVDFADITTAGTVARPWTGTRLGNCGGNTGITFPAAKTVYWNLSGSQNWSSIGWATTNNGTPAVNNFPLAQDTATFTQLGNANTVTMDANWNIGSIQMADGISNRTTAFTLATGTTTPKIYGNITLFSSLTLSGTGTVTFSKQGAIQTITSAGITFNPNIEINTPNNTFQLNDACTLNTGSAFILTRGTLDLNGNTLSTGIFSSNNTNTRSITFGSANISLTRTTAATTILLMANTTNFTYTGTGAFTRNMVATATVQFGSAGGGTASNAPNLTVNAGASALTVTSNSYFKNVVFTGSTSTVTATYNACGNLTLATGGTYTSVVPTFIASGTITSVGKTLGNTTINGSGITVTLGDAATLSITNTFNLTAGTLDLNGNTLSTGIFSSSNSNTRSIIFGSANITLTSQVGLTTVLAMGTATNFTYTGTGAFTRNMNFASATVQFGSTAGGATTNAPNLTITGGPNALTVTSGSYFKNVVFTGSTSIVIATYNACGNLTLATGGTFSSVVPTFLASGTLTSVGKTLGNVTIDGSGITVTLADALNASQFILTQGTFTAANFNVTVTNFSSNNSNTRTLNMGSGTWIISNAGIVWDVLTSINLTVNPSTSTINMTNASAKTFAGGGKTYYNLNQGGAGTLTITGANTFNNITNSNATASQITFPASTTTTVNSFTLSGSAGNLVSLRSSISGTKFTLSDSSGTTSPSYLDIKDSNATGGALWKAYLAQGNVNSGNNTGWSFEYGNFIPFLSN